MYFASPYPSQNAVQSPKNKTIAKWYERLGNRNKTTSAHIRLQNGSFQVVDWTRTAGLDEMYNDEKSTCKASFSLSFSSLIAQIWDVLTVCRRGCLSSNLGEKTGWASLCSSCMSTIIVSNCQVSRVYNELPNGSQAWFLSLRLRIIYWPPFWNKVYKGDVLKGFDCQVIVVEGLTKSMQKYCCPNVLVWHRFLQSHYY